MPSINWKLFSLKVLKDGDLKVFYDTFVNERKELCRELLKLSVEFRKHDRNTNISQIVGASVGIGVGVPLAVAAFVLVLVTGGIAAPIVGGVAIGVGVAAGVTSGGSAIVKAVLSKKTRSCMNDLLLRDGANIVRLYEHLERFETDEFINSLIVPLDSDTWHENINNNGKGESDPGGVHPDGIHPEGVLPEGFPPEGIHPEGVLAEGIHPDIPDNIHPDDVNNIRKGVASGARIFAHAAGGGAALGSGARFGVTAAEAGTTAFKVFTTSSRVLHVLGFAGALVGAAADIYILVKAVQDLKKDTPLSVAMYDLVMNELAIEDDRRDLEVYYDQLQPSTT